MTVTLARRRAFLGLLWSASPPRVVAFGAVVLGTGSLSVAGNLLVQQPCTADEEILAVAGGAGGRG